MRKVDMFRVSIIGLVLSLCVAYGSACAHATGSQDGWPSYEERIRAGFYEQTGWYMMRAGRWVPVLPPKRTVPPPKRMGPTA